MNPLSMGRFRKVSWMRTGTPGDAGALERALRVCERTGAALEIVCVVEQPPERATGCGDCPPGAEKCDVIVMGTVCRTGVPGVLIGNTAESVLDQIDCSLVALKPPGFDSPVRL